MPRGTGAFLGSRYSQAEVAAFGGVNVAGIRSSERIRSQPNAEASQMERAQKIAMQRDQAMDPGNNRFSRFTVASFSNESILAKASKLGVSLGSSPSQILESVNTLKEVDLQRTLVMLKNKKCRR
jgi:hypothetical protein